MGLDLPSACGALRRSARPALVGDGVCETQLCPCQRAAADTPLLLADGAHIWAGDARPLKWLNSEATRGVAKAQRTHAQQKTRLLSVCFSPVAELSV